MNKETRHLNCELKDHEILSFGQEQSKLLKEVSDLKEQKAALQRQITPRTKRIDVLAEFVDSGIEERPVPCEWEYNWDGGTKVLRRLDTFEIIANCDITEGDRQLRMPGEE